MENSILTVHVVQAEGLRNIETEGNSFYIYIMSI